MLTAALLLAGYPTCAALFFAADALCGWPIADALGHPHPTRKDHR